MTTAGRVGAARSWRCITRAHGRRGVSRSSCFALCASTGRCEHLSFLGKTGQITLVLLLHVLLLVRVSLILRI